MIDRNYSTLTMKRRAKRRDWRSMAIGIALVLGIILVAIAFIFRDDAGDIPDAPESRSITEHASTNTVELDDNTSPELAMAPNDSDRPASALVPNTLGSPGAPNAAPNAAKQPAIGQMPNRQNAPNAPAGDNTRHAQAMVDFARLPIQSGAVAPKLGHFRIQQTDIVYDAATKPEDILRDQASHYTVVSGDILGRIAQKHGCSIEQIQKANQMTDDKIKIGQKILIPNCTEPSGQ